MTNTADAVRIFTASSSASATAECRGHVLVSGSYGGEYNAYHAAKWGIRGVVLNDCTIGKDDAGIRGLPYLDRIGLAAATADAWTGRIADGDDMLERGIISHVNRSATALGCKPGQGVRECAELMHAGPVVDTAPPAIGGGKRFVIRDEPGEPKVICLDAAPLLEPGDAGAIAITGSHAALFRGRPDNVIGPDVYAIFFSDAGVGKDESGIQRLPALDERGIAAATASASSAPIGDSRAIYHDGILSHVNKTAAGLGARVGMPVKDFVARLVTTAKERARP